jgi:hypothetical protein
VRGRLLKTAYQLHYHYLGEWPLDGCFITLAIAGAIFPVLWNAPALGWAGALDAFWPVVFLLLLLALLARVFRHWAAGQGYVIFVPDAAGIIPPPGEALQPAAKILHRATGWFEVEGKGRYFANLLAYWRTFATREHAVMAIVHSTAYLLVGHMPDRDVGLWYVFFCPDRIRKIAPGLLTFGAEQRPALRVAYQTPELSDFERRRLPWWKRRRRFSRQEQVYLSFDDDEARRQVWADLLADGETGLEG